MKKKFCCPGLKKHGMTISRRGPNLRKGEQKIRHKKKRYKMKFVDDFVRPSESQKVKEKSGRRKNNGRRDLSSPKPNPKPNPKLLNPDEVRETHIFFCCMLLLLCTNIAILVPLLFLFHYF